DSIGANISEGVGRGTYQDNRRFVRFARESLDETQNWLRRAYNRKLLTADQVAMLTPLVDELGPERVLKSIGRRGIANLNGGPSGHAGSRASCQPGTTDNSQRTTDNGQ